MKYNEKVNSVFVKWKNAMVPELKNIQKGVNPKKLVHEVSESLLHAFGSLKLINNYDVYQNLMVYWNDVMQDDVYVISDDGWQSGREVYRITKQTKQKDGKSKSKEIEGLEGIESKLLKPYLLINNYFDTQKKEIEVEKDSITAELEAMEEEHGGDEGLLAEAKNDKDKITAASTRDRLKIIKGNKSEAEEITLLEYYLKQSEIITETNKKIKSLQKDLEKKVWDKYKNLSDDEIKDLVVNHKWILHLENAIQNEMQRISQRQTQRIKELVDRYETPMPLQLHDVKTLEEKVNDHLTKMGFVWK